MAARRNIEAVVSAVGALLNLVVSWVKLVQDLGGEVGAVTYRLATKDGRVTLAAMAKLAVDAIAPPVKQMAQTLYALTVNYGQSIKDLVAAGHYDWTHPDINDQNFPLTNVGTTQVNGELFHYDREMTTGQVLADLEVKGYRPGNIAELLVFGATYPELQRQFPIIALGSVWQRLDGHRYVASLGRDASERDLRLDLTDRRWLSYCRFLAVRK